jgi:hypothetical protein
MLAAIVLVAGLVSASLAQVEVETWRRLGWGQTDFSKRSVELSSIISGGVPKDGIRAVDSPNFRPHDQISGLEATMPVIAVRLAGEARAYPLGILTRREIVNDAIGDIPIAVTYCPLCNSAVVFERRVDGRTLQFGVTGNLRNSDMVMFDRQTESWWQQLTGEAIVGELTGARLKLIPSRVQSFETFVADNPQGVVLAPSDGDLSRYSYNPYAFYDTGSGPMFPVAGDVPDDIEPLARVVMFGGREPQAVALSVLRERGTMRIGDVELSWTPGQNSALDTRAIGEGRDVGNVVVQQVTPAGREDIVYDVTFAFVFYAFFPDRPIIKG